MNFLNINIHSDDNNDNLEIHSLENSINLITTDTTELNENIPKLLEDQDILINIEEGTNSTTTLKSNKNEEFITSSYKADILLENFVNLNQHYDYDKIALHFLCCLKIIQIVSYCKILAIMLKYFLSLQ